MKKAISVFLESIIVFVCSLTMPVWFLIAGEFDAVLVSLYVTYLVIYASIILAFVFKPIVGFAILLVIFLFVLCQYKSINEQSGENDQSSDNASDHKYDNYENNNAYRSYGRRTSSGYKSCNQRTSSGYKRYNRRTSSGNEGYNRSSSFSNSAMNIFAGLSKEEARSKYRKLMKELHPDNNGGSTEECRKVNAAYDYYKKYMA